MSDKLKKLTGKNPKDFEPVAYELINAPDVELFAELVSQDDFLFDFVKQNVAKRLSKICNESNYLNLLKFIKYYSPDYEDFIISNLVEYADEDLTDRMLEIFENGSENEKTYCAKFFAYIQDPLALDLLKKNAYSENSYLSGNCASTLAILGDKDSFNSAIKMLDNEDNFKVLAAVRFLIAYGNKEALSDIIKAMKHSSFSENIAGEIPYLYDLLSLYEFNREDCLYTLNLIINGLGEILGLSSVFDFQLYDIFEMLIKNNPDSISAVVILNAQDKFNTLTENDEYLFDETKDTKQEVLDIKNLLNTINKKELNSLSEKELNENSLFVYTALDFTKNTDKVRKLLTSENQTLVLRALEILKKLGSISDEDRKTAFNSVSNENIKNVIMAI